MSKWNTDYKKQAGFLPDPLFIQEGSRGTELPRQAVTLSREKGRSLRNTKKPPVHLDANPMNWRLCSVSCFG